MKTFITIIIFVVAAASVKAQTENTSERLITQLKRGTVPGWQFATNVPAKKAEAAVEQKESLITQIRKGTAPGMKFQAATAGDAAMRSMPNTGKAQAGTLASEGDIKKETLKTIAAPLVIPTQEAVKQENKQ